MRDKTSKAWRWLSTIRALLWFDPRENELFRYFKAVSKQAALPDQVVLVQCVEDPFYYGLFGQIASSLQEHASVRIEAFVLRSLNVGESKSIFYFSVLRLIGVLQSRKWMRLYKAFCSGIGYSSTSFQPIHDVIDLYRSWACWRNLKDRKALVDLAIGGIAVGDLVNDSFLRFKPSHTVALDDIYLWVVLWQTYRDVRRAKKYFEHVRPKIYLTSYSTYIQHGIAVRVALR